MSGIKSLLQYRFQRKEGQKLAPASNGTTDGDKASPEKSEGDRESVVPETPESKISSSPRSPVIGSWSKKRGARILLSDSESEHEASPTKTPTASSMWLSKESATKANGACSSNSSKKKAASMRSPSPQCSSSQGSMDERELYSQVTSLLDMFPTFSRDVAEEAIRSTANFEKAIDYMITYSRTGQSIAKKRSRQLSFGSTDSESVDPPAKKSRQMSYDDSHEDTTEMDSQATILLEDAAECAPIELPPHISKEIYDDRISFLKEAFSNIPIQALRTTLKNKNFEVEPTLDALASYDPDSYKPMSLTKSHGSIKMFKAARSQARRSGKGKDQEPDDDEDDDYENDGDDEERHSGHRPKVKSRIKAAMASDDEDTIEGTKEEQDTAAILNFFNTATVEELTAVNGCSKKKAEYIHEIRAFDDWDDLVSKFENAPSGKTLSFNLITNCKEVMKIRGIVKKVMERCSKLAGELGSFVSDLTTKTDMDDADKDKGYVTKQPRMLNEEMKLAPYQMIGLNWLILMNTQELNGILGDEMGLGKTIQTIAFLTYLLEEGERGPHVIVAPSSTIDNWLRELKKWSPDLNVLLYYGSQDERREIRYSVAEGSCEEFNVVVTSYNLASGSAEDRAFFKKTKFHYSVFDEGHMLKNMSSIRYQSLMKIRAERRLLLTGTPLQNNLIELMSLLAFVMPDLFTGKTEHMKKIFQSISSGANQTGRGNYEAETIAHAKRILQPFFLRRLKTQVLQQLPKKEDEVLHLPLAFEQQELYDELRAKFTVDMRKNLTGEPKTGKKEPNRSGASMLMQLRKAANHHLLHRRQFDASRLRQMAKLMIKEPSHQDANVDYIYEDMEVLSDFELHQLCKQYRSISKYQLDQEQITDSGKFRHLDELLPNLKEKDDRVLIFSQFVIMLDIIEPYLKSRKHKFIRLDGTTPVAERQELIDRYNSDQSIFIFLLSTRAGGLGINLTAANTVIIHDIDFNPYNDKQAEDRCHRLGQTKEVMVYRLISKGTIEEAMHRAAQGKLQLEKDVTGREKGDEMESNDVAGLLKEALEIVD